MNNRPYDARQLPALLSVKEYAGLLGISETTVRKQCAKGQVACFKAGPKLWRIDKNAVLDRINERSTTT